MTVRQIDPSQNDAIERAFALSTAITAVIGSEDPVVIGITLAHMHALHLACYLVDAAERDRMIEAHVRSVRRELPTLIAMRRRRNSGAGRAGPG